MLPCIYLLLSFVQLFKFSGKYKRIYLHVYSIWFLNPRWEINEPCHDKTNIMRLRPAWIQTSLRIRAVWSGSMLFAISFSTCYRGCKRTAGWSGSMLAANPLCWCCRDAAQMTIRRNVWEWFPRRRGAESVRSSWPRINQSIN
jgi:hypothetical protein